MTKPRTTERITCSAGFQPAVSPTSSRQSVIGFHATSSAQGLRIGNPRYSRLETCATLYTVTAKALHLRLFLQAPPATTLSGLNSFWRLTQGSSLLATLG